MHKEYKRASKWFKKFLEEDDRKRKVRRSQKIAEKIFEAVCSCANRSQNKCTFIMTPLLGLFLTCGGEKCTVLYNIQCFKHVDFWMKKPYMRWFAFDAWMRIFLQSSPMLQVNCPLLHDVSPTPPPCHPWSHHIDHPIRPTHTCNMSDIANPVTSTIMDALLTYC